MHRILSLLLILLLLPCPILAESSADRLAQLDIISQYDARIQDERYYYRDMYFRIAGCLPASVTNALTALLASPQTNVPELLVELRNGLSYDRSNKKAGIDLYRLPSYLHAPRETATELRMLLRQVTSVSLISPDMAFQEPAALLQQFLTHEDAHPLLLREFSFNGSWPWLINTAAALCDLGHPDARIALCSVGVGTADSDGPFNLGKSGHYATLYFQAGEFCIDGTFYLLDSYPRALEGDIYGFREHYPACYPFVEKPKLHRINAYYTPTRISDTVIQFTLLPKELEALRAAQGIDRTVHLLQLMNTVVLYSNPYCMIYIP